MELATVDGPEEGAMRLVFECSACGRQMAMHTNAGETRIVRSLGLKIEGRQTSRRPTAREAESGCPFSSVANEAFERAGIPWTAGARVRVERIPSFAREMAMKGVEDYARAKGYAEISEDVLDEARGRLGM